METMKLFDDIEDSKLPPATGNQNAHQMVNTAQQDREIAINIYSLIVDQRSKTVNQQGLKLCQMLKIDPETVLPKKLE